MFELNIESNIKEFMKSLDDDQKKQVPYATKLALDETAKDVQDDLVIQAQTVFNNKTKWYVQGSRATGIRIIKAKKKLLIATVYTDAYFAGLQEEGGIKRPYRSKTLLIPTKNAPVSPRRAGGAVARALRSKNVFSDKRGIFQRTGGTKRKNQKLILLFHRDETANIKPRFEFKRTAFRTAYRVFEMNFWAGLHEAMRTARK
jgi:hypothetical protein